MFGGNSDNNPCDVTCSEVKKRYKCNKLKNCLNCSKKKICQRQDAKKYRSFEEQQKTELKRRYSCPIRRKICSRKCLNYKKCNRQEKKNHEEWTEAYKIGNKEILEKISKQYRGKF